MKPLQVCAAVIFILLPLLVVVSLLSSKDEGTEGLVKGSVHDSKNKGTIIFNLMDALPNGGTFKDDDNNFIVQGFKYYNKLPLIVKKITRNFLPKRAWLLQGKLSVGIISLHNLQREQQKLQSVLVVIKYYTSWNWAVNSEISVTGSYYNNSNDQWEEEEEKLPDITAGDPVKAGFCQKLIYFGTVDDVKIEGRIKNTDDALVLISEIKIVVGPSAFDNVAELIC